MYRLPDTTVEAELVIVKLARLVASRKEGLSTLLLLHHTFGSTVAVGNIEQINESPLPLMTNGQQMVASPIVAASKGTGTM
jgi:hypothetical protein